MFVRELARYTLHIPIDHQTSQFKESNFSIKSGVYSTEMAVNVLKYCRMNLCGNKSMACF